MTPIRLFASTIIVVALASCGNQSDDYDTSNPYGTADSGSYADTPAAPSNPIYDTPAAYEENSGGSSSQSVPDASYTETTPSAPARKPSTQAASPTRAGSTTHIVVKGDSLWSISKKYKVSVASIKSANNLTSDVVVLGKKLVIPAN